MNWLDRHIPWIFLVMLITYSVCYAVISTWISEKAGWIFLAAVPAVLVGYFYGLYRGKNKVGEEARKAEEDAHLMILLGSKLTRSKIEPNIGYTTIKGATYSYKRFEQIVGILENEAKRHRSKAEEEERIVEKLLAI
ncbi:hypothetical protein ACFLUX_01425 [Chloroflexota bacterium]